MPEAKPQTVHMNLLYIVQCTLNDARSLVTLHQQEVQIRLFAGVNGTGRNVQQNPGSVLDIAFCSLSTTRIK